MYDLKGSKKLQSSTENRPIFEDLEGSRPKPRTSKTVLEDFLEAATFGSFHLRFIKVQLAPTRMAVSSVNNLEALSFCTRCYVWHDVVFVITLLVCCGL